MLVRLSMAVVLLTAAAVAAKQPGVPDLAVRMANPDACEEAARALGALGGRAAAAIPQLLEAVARGDRCAPPADAAVVTLVRFDNQAARAAAERIHQILTNQTREIDPRGRRRLVTLFGRMARLRDDGQPFLSGLLDDPDLDVARAAAVGLGANYAPDPALTSRLDAMLADPGARMRAAHLITSAASCTRHLTWLSRAVELFALDSNNSEYEAIVDLVYSAMLEPGCGLENVDHKGHPVFLANMTAHENEQVAAHCARMLGRTWPNERLVAQLAHRLLEPPHPSAYYRSAVIDGLAQSGRKAELALPLLEKALTDSAPSVRLAAVEALAVLGPVAGSAKPRLTDLARDDPDPAIRRTARRALGETFGWPIEPRHPSRVCFYRTRGAARVCCEPECPRWADLGTRATADPSRGVFAGIGVLPRAAATSRRAGASPAGAAGAALRRYLSGFMAAAVRDYLNAAPRANFRARHATRAQRALRLDVDPLLRANAERFARDVLTHLDGQEVDTVVGRAALLTLSVDDFLAAVHALRDEGSRDLIAAIETRAGTTFDRPDLVARGSADAAKPDWVLDGSGLFVTEAGLVLRGLGAGAAGNAVGERVRRADRQARAVLVDVLADFGARCLAEYRRNRPDPGNHLVTEAGWIASEAATVTDRWRDADGRDYALATMALADYLAFLARIPVLSSELRRFCDARAEEIFRREAVVLAENDAPVWPATDAPAGPGRVVPTLGDLVVGGVARNGAGEMIALTHSGDVTALVGLAPDGAPIWQRAAPWAWRQIVALEDGNFLVAGYVDDSSADPAARHAFNLTRLAPAGDIQSQQTIRLVGWREVIGVAPEHSGSVYLSVGDRAYGEGRHRKVLLARVTAGGRPQWTREVAGWGAVSLPGVVPLDDGGVVVLADAVHCLDPKADSGCDGDAMCDWNSAHARCGWNKALTRYADNGHVLWERHFKLEGRPSNLAAMAEGYVFAVVSSGEVNLIRVDASGRIQWTRSSVAPIAAIPEAGQAVRAEDDGGVVLVGVSTAGDVLVLEHGADGQLTRQRRFGGRGRDVGHVSFSVGDGTIVLGDTDSIDLPGASPSAPHGLYVIPLAASPE